MSSMRVEVDSAIGEVLVETPSRLRRAKDGALEQAASRRGPAAGCAPTIASCTA